MSRPYLGPSDAQANAEALARRAAPAALEHQESIRRSWDYRARQPRDLREAVRMVRRAYQDEIPEQLHDGPDSIGEAGTPRFSAPAEGYLFGSPESSDARRDPVTKELEAVSWYRYPFQATLEHLGYAAHARHPKGYVCIDAEHRRAAIVGHITIGQRGPKEAAIAEGVPSWIAGDVAELVLRAFLRSLSDLRLMPGRVKDPDAEESAA